MKLFDENDLVSVCALSYAYYIEEYVFDEREKKRPMRR